MFLLQGGWLERYCHSTWYKQECSWVPKIKEGKIQSYTGQTQTIVKNFQCAWSASSKGRNSSVSEINMHTITMVFCYNSSFSILALERFACSSFMVWRVVVSGISQGLRSSDRYIHKNGSYTQYSPTVLKQENSSPHSSLLCWLSFLSFTLFLKRILLLAVQVSHASSPLSSFFCVWKTTLAFLYHKGSISMQF